MTNVPTFRTTNNAQDIEEIDSLVEQQGFANPQKYYRVENPIEIPISEVTAFAAYPDVQNGTIHIRIVFTYAVGQKASGKTNRNVRVIFKVPYYLCSEDLMRYAYECLNAGVLNGTQTKAFFKNKRVKIRGLKIEGSLLIRPQFAVSVPTTETTRDNSIVILNTFTSLDITGLSLVPVAKARPKVPAPVVSLKSPSVPSIKPVVVSTVDTTSEGNVEYDAAF